MSCRNFVLSLVITLVLLANAAVPMTAYAQEPLPPPDGAVTEEAPPPEGAVTEVAPPTDELPADVAPITEEAATEADPTLAEPVVEEETPADEAPAGEEPTLQEVLEVAPEGTEVAVLDSNGEPLPLASNEAAQILTTGDPMWCPGSSVPGAGCTTGYASFAELITDLADDTETGPGIIYVADDYVAPAADAGGVFFNWGDYSLTNLVIQGGWDFDTNTQGGTSTITVPMSIVNWGSGTTGTQLTLNNLIFSGGASLNIYGGTVANVTLTNVTVKGSTGDGARIDTSGNITVNDGVFSRNAQDGLDAISGGDIELNNVITRVNGENGAQLDAADDITVNLGVYSLNSEDGLNADAGGNIYLNGVIARENEDNGINAWADWGFTVNGGRFSRNGENGLLIATGGNMDISDARARRNGSFGILAAGGLNPEADLGIDGNAVTLNDVIANGNYDGGVAVGSIYGGVSLANVIGNNDGLVGIAAGSVYGPVTLNTIYSDASYLGVVGGSVFGDVTMQNVETYDHFLGTLGVSVFGDTALANVTSEDGAVGVLALGLGDISLTQIYADYNEYVGVAALSLGGIELVDTFGLDEEDFDFFPYILGEDFGSDLFGALETSGSTPGTISLNTIEANYGDGIGVVVAGIGDTSLTNVNANENAFAGVIDVSVGQTLAEWLRAYAVWLMNDPEPGTYPAPNAITEASGGAGNTTLINVTTNANGFVGTLALAGGSASLTNVTANDNGLLGVAAISLGGLPLPTEDGSLTWPGNGSTTLIDVNASGNGLIGGAAVAPGDVYVGNSVFNENGLLGLAAISLEDGDVTVYKVYALDNGVDVNLPLLGSAPFGSMGMGLGVFMGSMTLDLEPLSEWFIAGPYVPFFPTIEPSDTGGSNLICSVATGNSGYGLGAISNTVVSSSVLSPNGLGDSTEMGGEVTVGPDVNCTPCEGEDCDAGGADAGGEDEGRARVLLIPATGCGDVTLSDGGVTAVLHNLCGHEATLKGGGEADLPGDLPSGASLSVVAVIVTPDLPLPGHSITLSFPVPSGADAANLAVLFWNGSEWVEVPGGTVVDGMFVVTVTEGGTYVLVQQ